MASLYHAKYNFKWSIPIQHSEKATAFKMLYVLSFLTTAAGYVQVRVCCALFPPLPSLPTSVHK